MHPGHKHRFLAVLSASALFVLNACGGGGGSGPEIRTPIEAAKEQTERVEVRRETSAVVAPTVVLSYLQNHASGGPWYSGSDRGYSWTRTPGLHRFPDSPTVRIAKGTDPHRRSLIHHAVGLVNRALPYDHHLQIGVDSPPNVHVRDVPDGQIFVDIAAPKEWGIPGLDENTSVVPTGIAHFENHANGRRAGRIMMDGRTTRIDPDDRVAVSILVHELLHVLGFNGHVAPDQFPESFIRETLPPRGTAMSPVDIAALQVLYTRLDTITAGPDAISIDDLGSWENEAVGITGSLAGLSFGVRRHNGVSVPWTDGNDPSTSLALNRSLRGTVTWEGKLIGFTDTLETVDGDAEIRVDPGTLTGNADFTDLKSGSGTQWLEGDLSYTIAVGGNYIRSTGGDDGTLNGRFYGASHEGVAGSVERQDLTATFGGTR